ncbi:MAG: translocase FtsK, partial [Bryobacterales bacterium]|nr:translocase FtsK [Bryobacterales bacterium]
MKLFTPTQSERLNEAVGVVFLMAGIFVLLSFASFHPADASLNTVTGPAKAQNLTGPFGAYLSDFFLQAFGLASFVLPLLFFGLGWKWIRSEAIEAPGIKMAGSALLLGSAAGLAALLPDWRLFENTITTGGAAGFLIASSMLPALNLAGTIVVLATTFIVSVYIVSTFTLAALSRWFAPVLRFLRRVGITWRAYLERRRAAAIAKHEAKRLELELRLAPAVSTEVMAEKFHDDSPPIVPEPTPTARTRKPATPVITETMPWDDQPETVAEPAPLPQEAADVGDIPIRRLDEIEPGPANVVEFPFAKPVAKAPKLPTIFRLPSTELLNEIPVRSAFDEQELKDTAAAIKAKFEEFNVLGSVVQINPGPVVTTFEFRPDAGIKYSRIINLREDLSLALQAESILIERIPGRPTIGIEVPNRKRDVISLRAVLESEEFESSPSHLTISMGKDINGRIKVATLETMPHALIAGSTGSGKSVMINSLIMSVLFKSTPDEVRMIMVDPKRVELGMYEGIPHLLTPVITDPRKATNALKNAVLEMERRLRLLAEHGARNIDQFNKKVALLRLEPRSLFEEEGREPVEELKPLPYILILIDELADLMILEGRNVEESVTRLAQMARAVGMHLVLATQRPSVDVITGIIKANFPARISFRVATRVDSRTILDIMGAEHLLGKGDMLYLPPGSSRLTRVHGAFVTESE